MKNKDIKKGFAVITGASTGIGKEFALRCAREGYDLILVARNGAALQKLARQLEETYPCSARFFAVDLSSNDGIERVEDLLSKTEELSMLINNAGFGTEGAFQTLSLEREIKMVRLHCEAIVRLTHRALNVMIPRKTGHIINVSSLTSFYAMPFYATYGATKAFINSFSEAIAEEVAGKGIKIQVLCPGFTKTEFQDRAGIDVSYLPSISWMTSAEVVEASFEALRKNRLICIPGTVNQLQSFFRGPFVRAGTRRLLGYWGRYQNKT